MGEFRSYYAIIPANVRYCKNLTANAKLLYGELTALSNEKGFCWASNSYFAKLYEVSESNISRWIKNLHENGFINIVYIRNGREIKQRNIYIADTHEGIADTHEGIAITHEGIAITHEGIAITHEGYCKNAIENNTDYNNKDNIKSNNKDSFARSNERTGDSIYQKAMNSFNSINGINRKLGKCNLKPIKKICELMKEKNDSDFDSFFLKAKMNYESMSSEFHRFATGLDTIASKFENIYNYIQNTKTNKSNTLYKKPRRF